jgi:hypothetical protein
MRPKLMRSLLVGAALTLAAASAHADTNSYFAKQYSFKTLKTWDFKQQRRISRDPIANNPIWADDIRNNFAGELQKRGFERMTTGKPDFYVAFYVGLKERYDVRYMDYGFPGFRGRRFGGWGWPRDIDVWRVPYTDSTLIVDIIDARTNQLVWRGYDTNTIDMKNPDKRLDKAAESLIKKFVKDTNTREES